MRVFEETIIEAEEETIFGASTGARQPSATSSAAQRAGWSYGEPASRLMSSAGAASAQVFSNYRVLLLISAFLGIFGVDRFASGKVKTGVLKLITVGGWGVWWAVDYLTVLIGRWKDRDGNRIHALPSLKIKLLSAVPFLFGLSILGFIAFVVVLTLFMQ